MSKFSTILNDPGNLVIHRGGFTLSDLVKGAVECDDGAPIYMRIGNDNVPVSKIFHKKIDGLWVLFFTHYTSNTKSAVSLYHLRELSRTFLKNVPITARVKSDYAGQDYETTGFRVSLSGNRDQYDAIVIGTTTDE